MRVNTIRWGKSFRRHEIDQEACSFEGPRIFCVWPALSGRSDLMRVILYRLSGLTINLRKLLHFRREKATKGSIPFTPFARGWSGEGSCEWTERWKLIASGAFLESHSGTPPTRNWFVEVKFPLLPPTCWKPPPSFVGILGKPFSQRRVRFSSRYNNNPTESFSNNDEVQ